MIHKLLKNRKRGFTLVEILVAVLIAAAIMTTLIMVFRSNVLSWKWGQKRMGFNQKIQLVMKRIFTDIKNINPIVKEDSNGNLWFQGEKIGDLYPNIVRVTNTDGNKKNGGEELSFYLTNFSDLTRKDFIRYYLDKDKLMRQLIDYQGKKSSRLVTDSASNLHFFADPNDIHEVGVHLTIGDKKDPKLKEDLDFSVRLDTDLVCVKMYNNEKK